MTGERVLEGTGGQRRQVEAGWSDAWDVDYTAGGGHGTRPIVLSYSSSPPDTVPKGGTVPTTSGADGRGVFLHPALLRQDHQDIENDEDEQQGQDLQKEGCASSGGRGRGHGHRENLAGRGRRKSFE